MPDIYSRTRCSWDEIKGHKEKKDIGSPQSAMLYQKNEDCVTRLSSSGFTLPAFSHRLYVQVSQAKSLLADIQFIAEKVVEIGKSLD